MTPRRTAQGPRRLSADRVLQTALELTQRDGIEALSMRRLADALGVGVMSLYHYVPNKDVLLDGLIDLVFAEVELPHGSDWRAAMRRRAMSTREVLNRHRWAIGLLESRAAPGPNSMRLHDAVLGCLREGGFSVPETVRAYAVLDAYIYGFALQERSLPFDSPEEHASVLAEKQEEVPDMSAYPWLLEVAAEMAKEGYDFAAEFEFGLELILDGLERYRAG
jgi:AcrR family transcriptional regulator